MAYQSDIDFERVNILMQVVHNVATIAPRCTHILGAAMDELNAIDQEQQVVVQDKAKADAEAVQAQPVGLFSTADQEPGMAAQAAGPQVYAPGTEPGPLPSESGDMAPGPRVVRRTAVEAPTADDPSRVGSG